MPSIPLPAPDQTIVTHGTVILRDLQRLIGPGNVIGERCGRSVFEADAFAGSSRSPLAVVMPGSTQDVASILQYAHENRIKIVPRGAGTSTTGAAVPAEDTIVVCLSRMNAVLDIDYPNRTVTVEAGVTTAAITRAVAERGFFYAPDPGSAAACTIAGNIATDASGSRGIKYGTTSNHVLGLTLVLADGEILHLGGQHLDVAGYDIPGLLAGSEGQLGIVTQATLRIQRKPEVCRPVLLGFASVQSAGQCVAAILKAGIVPTAIEFMDKPAIEACEAYTNAGYPTDAEALIIVEVEGAGGEISSLQSKIVQTSKHYGPNIVRVAQNEDQSAAIWKGRRSVFGAIAADNESRWLDGAIPLGRLAEVLQSISEICKRHNLNVVNIFHAGDGTLHPILFHDGKGEPQNDTLSVACEEILRLCIDVGGALSGENGIGLEKRDLMADQFSEDGLAIQMRIKTAFDPDWMLNGAKMFPLSGAPAAGGSA